MGTLREVPSIGILYRWTDQTDSESLTMLQIKEWRISTWIAGLLPMFARSMPCVVSLDCTHCGSAFAVHCEAGTSSYVFVIDWNQQSLSRSRHVVALTSDGKLSISCVPSLSGKRPSAIRSGVNAGNCSMPENLHDQHGAGCVDELDND
jgi:hypothetical protein